MNKDYKYLNNLEIEEHFGLLNLQDLLDYW